MSITWRDDSHCRGGATSSSLSPPATSKRKTSPNNLSLFHTHFRSVCRDRWHLVRVPLLVTHSWLAGLQMPHGRLSSVALYGLLCVCHWPAQRGTGSSVGSKWRHRSASSHLKDRQTIRAMEGGTDREKRTSDIVARRFVVCLSCSDRRGVDLESVAETIKDDISLKSGLYGVTEGLLSRATDCVFSLTCPSPCMSSPL